MRRCAGRTRLCLTHSLIHLRLTIWCLPRLLCWCPWPPNRLLLLLLLLRLARGRRADHRPRLLVCIHLIPLCSRRILGTLCLQVGQCRRSCYSSSCESGLDSSARRWDDWRLGRWRRASLRFHGRCGRCRAQAIDAPRIGDVECLRRWLARGCACGCVRARRRPVLLVILGERVWICAALSLRRFRKQSLLIWCFWPWRVWERLGRCTSSLCQPRGLDRPVLISPSIASYARSVRVVRIESCARLWRQRSRCSVRASPASFRLWRSRVPCWSFALTERRISTLIDDRRPVVYRVWERRCRRRNCGRI